MNPCWISTRVLFLPESHPLINAVPVWGAWSSHQQRCRSLTDTRELAKVWTLFYFIFPCGRTSVGKICIRPGIQSLLNSWQPACVCVCVLTRCVRVHVGVYCKGRARTVQRPCRPLCLNRHTQACACESRARRGECIEFQRQPSLSFPLALTGQHHCAV